jgi:hypothetical protein
MQEGDRQLDSLTAILCRRVITELLSRCNHQRHSKIHKSKLFECKRHCKDKAWKILFNSVHFLS